MLRVCCPKCGKSLKVPPDLANRRVGCPRCRTPLAVAAPERIAGAPRSGVGGFLLVLLLVGLAAGGTAGWMAWAGKGPFAPAPRSGPVVASHPPAEPPPSTRAVKAADPVAAADPPALQHRGPGEDVSDNAPNPAAPGTGRRYALLVGVQKYDSKELTDLHYTEADIEGLAEVLVAAGYPAANLTVLTRSRGEKDPQALPTAERIRAALDGLLKKCGKDDLVLVAFAGHGIELRETKKFYFCPLQGKLTDAATLVSLNEIYDRLKGCAAGYKLLLADACRNDPGARGPRIIPEEANVPSVTRPQFAAPPGGVMAFYSCSASQYAYEPEDLQHGVFFHFLIEGLKGQADLDGDGEVIREELEAFVKKRVRSYTAEKLKREQWPHLLGESNDQRPLVKLPGSPKPPPERPKITRQEVVRQSRVLLDEDFQKVPEGKAPRGWQGRDLYAALKDKQGPAFLHGTGKKGVVAPLTLPDTPLTGDFSIECEFNLGSVWDSGFLDLRLEGMGESLRTRIDYAGVTLSDKPRRAAPVFEGKINRLRLVREGRVYRVSVNDSVVVASPLPYLGDFDRLHLYWPSGVGYGEVKLYAVRIGLLPDLGDEERAKAVTRKGTIVVNEDFTGVREGLVPRGWDGKDIVIVQKPESDRAALEVNEKKGVYSITLPPVTLRGDFFVEVEFILGGQWDASNLLIRLEGKGGGVLLDVYHAGTITVADKPPRKAEQFVLGGLNRLRVLREDGIYRLNVNDSPVAGASPGLFKGEVTRVELGLPALGQYGPRPKIFLVRIGVLDPPAEGR